MLTNYSRNFHLIHKVLWPRKIITDAESRDCRVVEGSGWGEVGGVLVPRVTTVVPEGAVRSHFNTDLNTGGVTPVFWGLGPKFCEVAPECYTTA